MARKNGQFELTCKFCQIRSSSSNALYTHLNGRKHLAKLRLAGPTAEPRYRGLQQYVEKYGVNDALLGLSYVEERQGDRDYSYTCELCDVQTDRHDIYRHISGTGHMKRYLDKHHPDIASYVDSQTPDEWQKTLIKQSLAIQKQHGKEKIKESKMAAEGAPPSKVPKTSPAPEEPCAASEDSESSVQETLAEKVTFLHFQHNAEFSDYVSATPIRSEEDATWAQGILAHCAMALRKFLEEEGGMEDVQESPSSSHMTEGTEQRQINREEVQGSPNSSHSPSAHRTDQKPGSMEESSSRSPMTVQCTDPDPNTGHRPHLPLDGSQSSARNDSDAMEVFFNRVKDLEASEVTAAFEKVFASNPAFKEIDIPNLIKYLQDTGRLKAT